MIRFVHWLFGVDELGGPRVESPRSPQWPEVRAKHLAQFPACAVCGSTEDVAVHHVKPFHLYPELELVPSNFLTLCERRGSNHHLEFGHLGLWAAWNPEVRYDALSWNIKRQHRCMVRT